MEIKIRNCNNIDEGIVEISPGKLNVKYAMNGIGKSTIAKALTLAIKEDTGLGALKPFKYREITESEHQPNIEGIDEIKSVEIFDQSYVDLYVYQPDELVTNSFGIFVKTPEYDKHMEEIQRLISEIDKMFQANPDLEELLADMYAFIEGFGKAKTGYSAAGALGKALGSGNKIANIPAGLEDYSEYLRHPQNFKWLRWQMGGNDYLDIANKCPYCTSTAARKETILRVSEEYDAKSVEHLNRMLEIFQRLSKYLSDTTNEKVTEIAQNMSGFSSEQKAYLLEIKAQITVLRDKLEAIKHVGFNSLKDIGKVVDELTKYKIDMTLLSHLNGKHTIIKIKFINDSLEQLLEKAGKLQGEINQQKDNIKKTIEQYHNQINSFLKYAGYRYSVSIEPDGQESYKMKLKHEDCDTVVDQVRSCLSFGEQNAFALVLFMYGALKYNPDLIILDDPVSSFDGDKQFAILNMLFMGRPSLKGRTVLLLTHEFNTVIDAIHNLPHMINPPPVASFLENRKGVLIEKTVTKRDIKSFKAIALANISNLNETLNKLIYLRRLLEIEEPESLAWQLLSNLFKKRVNPKYKTMDAGTEVERDMTADEIDQGNNVIAKYVPGFDYATELQKTQSKDQMLRIYESCCNNYEKLQIYRIINPENHPNLVIKKYVNETYHPENDYLFQLNPCEYEVVPHYIIDECNKDMLARVP